MSSFIPAIRLLTFHCDISGYNLIAHNWLPILPHVGNCAGKLGEGLIGFGIVATYLLLFVNFFSQTYSKMPRAMTSRNIRSKAKIDGISSVAPLFRVEPGEILSSMEEPVLTASMT